MTFNSEKFTKNLKRRHQAEARFRWYGRGAMLLAAAMLAVLLGTLGMQGYTGFKRAEIQVSLTIPSADEASIRAALDADKNAHDLLSSAAPRILLQRVQADTSLAGRAISVWLPASSPVDLYMKGRDDRRFLEEQRVRIEALKQAGNARLVFNTEFFTKGDSREPERAGLLGCIIGSVFTLLVCIAVAFPLGVATAIYLEEFARPSHLIDLVEVNINNLAAVPSIIFGLLGLSIFLNVAGMPRSASLVGGLTLALLILPIIIIATRSALRSIPNAIRDGARALGASPLQVVLHHTLPLAMPGIMTGTILGLARAIGETAPLLLIGMVAFVADIPHRVTDPATVMPVQIYLWASNPEAGFVEKTSAGILVLLAILVVMNSAAIYVRKRFELRW